MTPVADRTSTGPGTALSDGVRPYWPLLFLGLLGVAEIGYDPHWLIVGVVAHYLLLTAMLLRAATTPDLDLRNFALALSLVPAARIIAHGMTLDVLDPLAEEILIAVAQGIAAVQVTRLAGSQRPRLALWGGWRAVPPAVAVATFAAILSGAAAWFSGVQITAASLWVTPPGLAMGLLAALLIAAVEVYVYLGLLLPATQRLLGSWGSLLYLGLLWGGRFGLLPAEYILALTIEGLVLLAMTVRSRSIGGGLLVHWVVIVALYGIAIWRMG